MTQQSQQSQQELLDLRYQLNLSASVLHRLFHMATSNLLVLDTETTGMSGGDEVIELSIGDITGSILYSQLYRPTARINPHAMRVHGITFSKVIGMPRFDEAATEAIEEHITADTILLTWNGAFDFRMIRQSLTVNGCHDLIERWHDYEIYQHVCLMTLVKELTGKGKMSQAAALEFFGVEPPKGVAHRAEADCINLAALAQKLIAIANVE